MFGVAVVLGAAAVGMNAQDGKTTLVEPPAPLLPQQVGEWVRQADAPAPASDAKTDTILNEDGLKREEHGVYRVGAAGPQIAVTARQFVDATGAHAAYSYYERPGSTYRGTGLGSETSASSEGYLFRSGASVVEASGGRGPKIEGLLEGIETRLPKIGGPKGLAPVLPTYVPAKGLERDSVKYALGPVSYEATGGVLPGAILGFDKAGEAVTAKYAGKGTLTLLTYPTPQIAGDRLRAIEGEIHPRGQGMGTVVLRREGALVLMTSGRWTESEAKSLVAGIHPRSEVTWNKQMPPEFHAEIGKTYSLLSSIMIFCGFGVLAAVILGLFLGGGRAGWRVLHGKPAASEPEFLRIDLSGSVAPVSTEGNHPGA
ncbi:MAG: hypothetical protein PW789_15555 [Edaphobacter sp.]|uniref:DUF6599 family protein n=1 Tax=Edaphobacter sp. TaxID=1934404 RepID=UPI00239A31B9|nr:DUF6599 family protein [Edaphobacter sp.]MDE1177995.1 hypothetical protein [Edaphobacter sp.]